MAFLVDCGGISASGGLFPKPGRWMNTVKVFFSGMLLITSLWLISLLASFIDVLPVAVSGCHYIDIYGVYG